jgi:alginate O-acetyltransferase complex protein AlgI
MLFNSPEFVFAFLPIVLAIYWLVLKGNKTLFCALVLVAASLFFYAYWNPKYLVLFLGSMGGNYLISRQIFAAHGQAKRWLLFLGIAFNLGLLGYFKYAGFMVENAAVAFDQPWSIEPILLPLAISFFTFQQIAYLVDCHRGEVAPPPISKYLLFISFFPQLIAGPIVHHYEMLPQLDDLAQKRDRLLSFLIGSTFFFAGLFKKLVLADSIGAFADPVFDGVAQGAGAAALDAWTATFAFGFQIYFDFSGYSDMAIGLALLFGIRLPLNFSSPYKATSIIDFWRRWHMTLSRFLRDHLYIPLGGNRHGAVRQLGNMMIVMLLGGLWHGAGWGFVLWGGLHGAYLVINHLWRRLIRNRRLPAGIGGGVTFLAVMVAWVPFRAETWQGTATIWRAMAGLSATDATSDASMTVWFGMAHNPLLPHNPGLALAWLAILSGFVWLLPNTQSWLPFAKDSGEKRPLTWRHFTWRPTTYWAIFNGAAAIIALSFMIGRPGTQEFLYFQF